MPIYNYLCKTCGHEFEIQHKMLENAPARAPECETGHCVLEKQLSPVTGIVRHANPFISKSGAPIPASSVPSEKSMTLKSDQHQCSQGCALHK